MLSWSSAGHGEVPLTNSAPQMLHALRAPRSRGRGPGSWRPAASPPGAAPPSESAHPRTPAHPAHPEAAGGPCAAARQLSGPGPPGARALSPAMALLRYFLFLYGLKQALGSYPIWW